LIVWSDPDSEVDIAVSFQMTEGCQQIWDEIRIIQGREPDAKQVIASEKSESNSQSELHLPKPEMSNLTKILEIIVHSVLPKDKIAEAITTDGFLDDMFELFDMCEDLKEKRHLATIFNIFKTSIMLDDNRLYDTLFSEKYINKLMGALEYDPDLPILIGKANHREYLTKVVVYKQVVPFTNKETYSKIHQTFKIQYIKDTVLPRNLDDQTFQSLSTIILLNNQEIAKMIMEDTEFCTSLFLILEGNTDQVIEAVKFLQEFCNMIKTLQMDARLSSYSLLTKFGFFDYLERYMIDERLEIRKSIANIFHVIISFDPLLFRRHLVKQDPKCRFFHNMIAAIVEQSDTGVQEQILDSLQIILEPDNLGEYRDEVLSRFYEDHLGFLVAKLREDRLTEDEGFGNIEHHICELLSFFVKSHGYRIKNYILKNHTLKDVLKLTQKKEKYLILGALKFFKAMIASGEIFYHNYIIQHHCFGPVMDIWRKNSKKYNLIHSAIVDIFEILKKDNMKKLMAHLYENYDELLSLSKIDLLKNAKRKKDDDFIEGKQEEDYFLIVDEAPVDLSVEPNGMEMPTFKKRKTVEDDELSE
jgi:protein phosphatase-4 regulatory subunit 3